MSVVVVRNVVQDYGPVLVAWGLVGVMLSWRLFKWEPVTDVARMGTSRQRRGRHRRPQPGRPDLAGE